MGINTSLNKISEFDQSNAALKMNQENLFDFDFSPLEFDFMDDIFDVTLKQAKSRDDTYSQFTDTLLCAPYKYDLKIKGKVSKELQILLVDSETNIEIESNGKLGLTVESIEFNNEQEVVIRFILNFCSFHFKKKSFKLFVYSSGKLIYTSPKFMTFARRRETKKPALTVFKNQKVNQYIVNTIFDQRLLSGLFM